LARHAFSLTRLIASELQLGDDPRYADRLSRFVCDLHDASALFGDLCEAVQKGEDPQDEYSMAKLVSAELFQRITECMAEMTGDFGRLGPLLRPELPSGFLSSPGRSVFLAGRARYSAIFSRKAYCDEAGRTHAEVAMDVLDRLIALEEIKKLKARYFRCVDTKDWAGLAQTFAPDIRFDRTRAAVVRNPWTGAWNPPLPPEELILVGRDAVVAMVRRAVEHLYTVHHGHMPEIDVLTETTAKGIWVMDDVLRDQQHRRVLQGSGHYQDTYQRLDGGWTIKTCQLTRLSLYLTRTGPEPIGYL
jgi:hypothetical protein